MKILLAVVVVVGVVWLGRALVRLWERAKSDEIFVRRMSQID